MRTTFRRVRTTTHDVNVVRAAVRMAETTDNSTLLAALDALIIVAGLVDSTKLHADAEENRKRHTYRHEKRMKTADPGKGIR